MPGDQVSSISEKLTILIDIYGQGSAEELAKQLDKISSTSLSRWRRKMESPSPKKIDAIIRKLFSEADFQTAKSKFMGSLSDFQDYIVEINPGVTRERLVSEIKRYAKKLAKDNISTSKLYIRNATAIDEFKALSFAMKGDYWVYHYWKNPGVQDQCCYIAKRLLRVDGYSEETGFIQIRLLSVAQDEVKAKGKNFDFDGIAFPTGDFVNFIMQSRFVDYEVLTATVTKSKSMHTCCGIISGRTEPDGIKGPTPAASFVTLIKLPDKMPEGTTPFDGVGNYFSPDDDIEFKQNNGIDIVKLLSPPRCNAIKVLLSDR